MFCIKCGTKLPDNSNFCSKCGNKISETPVRPEPEAQPATDAVTIEEQGMAETFEMQPNSFEEPVSFGMEDVVSGVADKAKKGISKGLLWGIIGGAIALVLVIVSIFVLPALFESDEDKINACLDGFEEAYNNGDMDAALEYCTADFRAAANIGIGIGDALLGDALGIDVGFGDMLGLSAGMNEGDMMDIADRKIEHEEDAETATVTAVFKMNFSVMGQTMTQEQPVTFRMKEVDGEWLIAGMQ